MSDYSSKIKPFLAALTFFLFGIMPFTFAQAAEHEAAHTEAAEKEPLDVSGMIFDHVLDSHVWHLWEGHGGTIFLPVIVYSGEKGLDVFSSKNFFDEHHNPVAFNGYKLEHNHITLADSGKEVLDLSITKNVAMLLINAIVLVVLMLLVARGYKRNAGKAPSGIQSFIEPIIIFVRDEIAKPNLGKKTGKYLPYLLTLFFFILFGNFLGLLPGSANLTGNIAVTATLAMITFLITIFSGNKQYWGHILWTPGVPLPLRLIILPVEIIGVFTKPISLMIRLFVAITAGHIVILSLIALAFIFQSHLVGVGSTLLILFINLIELLVAGIQAYVFTLFTALYIGSAVAEDHH